LFPRRVRSRESSELQKTVDKGVHPLGSRLNINSLMWAAPKAESRELIATWAPGSGIEDFVVSAIVGRP